MGSDKPHTPSIDELTRKLANDTIDSNELHDLEELCHESGDKKDEAVKRLAHYMAAQMMSDGHEYDSDAAYARFMERISTEKSASDATADNKRRHSLFHISKRRWIIAAAAVVLLLLLPLATLIMKDFGHAEPELIASQAAAGQQLSLSLPDGTTVVLGAGSRISYAKEFSGSIRQVMLEGDALFDVVHSDRKPFEVVANGVVVRDVGTRFRVTDYQGTSSSRVEVMQGIVDVSWNKNTSKAIRMHRGDGLLTDKSTGQTESYALSSSSAETSDMNIIVISNEKLSDTAIRLSKIYGVNISVSDDCRNKQCFGVFNVATDPIGDVVEAVAAASGAQVAISNGGYTIHN